MCGELNRKVLWNDDIHFHFVNTSGHMHSLLKFTCNKTEMIVHYSMPFARSFANIIHLSTVGV